ncbi:hypothetical protein H4R21_004479 [Coemansia helicoidea]|uniref:Uncharacterized protein n=1 Tax=Coemansia helicoidea TaxID=1286919 RepID=A0ACC1KXC5_9FUNG|nr:hypothetical protein H4R21_004479 [Coemansia helicoidea]
MAVSFERSPVPKRGRGADESDASASSDAGRCLHYRKSTVAISAKRARAVESHV